MSQTYHLIVDRKKWRKNRVVFQKLLKSADSQPPKEPLDLHGLFEVCWKLKAIRNKTSGVSEIYFPTEEARARFAASMAVWKEEI